MHAAMLENRGVVEVRGPEAGELLQRLFTNDVLGLNVCEARYAALLTPQGKILIDFLVVACPEQDEPRYLLDCPGFLAPELSRKLTIYRLRAKVTITDRSAGMGVAAVWPDRPMIEGIVYRDPRREALGFRVVAVRSELGRRIATSEHDLYDKRRILEGVPEGGVDFAYGETFPHEANLDRLQGLDFKKGCYVGQEVVSRVEHRGTARKRVTAVSFEGETPPIGADVLAGEIVIGTMGSAIEGHGLAMVRIDRVTEAAALGAAVTSAGTRLMIATP